MCVQMKHPPHPVPRELRADRGRVTRLTAQKTARSRARWTGGSSAQPQNDDQRNPLVAAAISETALTAAQTAPVRAVGIANRIPVWFQVQAYELSC